MSDIETVVKVVIAAGAALAAWWAADKLSMTISNKHLHEHVAEKFKAFADSIRDWCRQHAQTLKKGTKIFLRLASDAVGTGLKQTGKALVRTGGKLTAGKNWPPLPRPRTANGKSSRCRKKSLRTTRSENWVSIRQ